MPADGIEPGTCKSCQAPIYWVKMAGSGKAMPVDRGADSRVLVERGEARVVTCYVSHFATCPQARQHRKSVIQSGKSRQKTLKE